jgi:uncharacterized protein (TIGR03437 family)
MRIHCGLPLSFCFSLGCLPAAVTPTPLFSTIHNFTGSRTGCAGCDGAVPSGGLALGAGGLLYGVTQFGGAYGFGTIYSLKPPGTASGAWTESPIYSFSSTGGTNPSGSLVIGTRGVLYGTTQYGGNSACSAPGVPVGCGTVFALSPPSNPGAGWTYSVLYEFNGTGDGALPSPGGVAMDSSGTLYGTTNSGGPNTCIGGIYKGCGVVYSLSPPAASGAWTETVLTDASTLGFANGGVSSIALTSAPNGATIVYSTAYNSESEAAGTVFSLSPPAITGAPWVTATIYSFTTNQRPSGSLVMGYGGVLYGATSGGSNGPAGAAPDQVFSLAPPATTGAAWSDTILYNFPPDDLPADAVTFSGGTLYGVTVDPNCATPCGTLFSLTPQSRGNGPWSELSLHIFTGGSDGGSVNGSLLVSPSGVIYGVTQAGGSSRVGTAFSLALAIPQPTVNNGGLVNAANYAPPVAPGSIASVFGGFLLPVAASADELPLQDNILDLSFTFNGNSPAPLVFVSEGQANLQVPWELNADAPATLTASLYGQTSVAQAVSVAMFAPAIFTTNAQGTGQGAVLDQSYRLVDASNPATPVDTVLQIFCTGLGPVTNQPPTGAPAPPSPLSYTTTVPDVTVGGVAAGVLFHGLAPGYVGLYQVNAQVPAGVPSGAAVPVVISMEGQASNTVTIAVQ